MSTERQPTLLVAWSLLVVIGLGWGLGTAPLGDQDEGRNGEVAREMAASNDYVLPHLNGLPYIDKPVLSFAATAAVMEFLGPTELAARTVPFVCTIATGLLVGLCAGRWFGREAGWVAGIAAVTAPLPLAFSRIVILDAVLALIVTSSLLAFLTAIEALADRRPDRTWTLIAWAAIGLGILTKGPVALAVPLMVATPYAIWRRASWAVWNPMGPLVAAAIVTPWVWFMEDRLPGYLRYVAITETWQRVSGDELQRTQPWWYFLVVGAVGFFPWWPVAIGGGSDRRSNDPRRVFFVLWLVVPLVFFSLSTSKLPQYILPLMPAVALLVASTWSSGQSLPRRAATASLTGWGTLGLVMAAAGFGALETTRIQPELLAVLPKPALAMAAVCMAAIFWAVISIRNDRGPSLIAALSLPLIALPVALQPVIEAAAERRSERALAQLIQTELPAETEVVGYRAWRPSLSFYLGRPVPILSNDGDELRSNYILRNYARWMDPTGPLRPFPPSPSTVVRCNQPRVILVHARRSEDQDLMDRAALEKIWTGPKLHAYFCDGAEAPEDPDPTPAPVDLR